jgi:hypothetical protein
MSQVRVAAIVVCLAVLAGCANKPGASLHQSMGGNAPAQMPKKVMLLPADFRVHEISAGGVVEKVDAWSEAANAHAMKSMREFAASRLLLQVKEAPPLSETDKEALEQHQALYERVANSADFARSGMFQPWRERAASFDYTLGPGLQEFADRQDVDAAIILIGSDYISSAGRKATMALGILAAAFTGVAVVPAGGIAFVSVGVVDMRTGNLLWFSTNRAQNNDLREEAEMRGVLEALLSEYPGVVVADAR